MTVSPMKLAVATIAGVLCVVPLFAYSQTAMPQKADASNAQESATISVPKTWKLSTNTATQADFTMLNMWYAPAPAMVGDNINLGYSPNPTGLPLADIVPAVKATLMKTFGANSITESHAERLCNGSVDGWLFVAQVTFGAQTLIVEEAILPTGDRVYAATYTRHGAEAEDPAARKAIDALCVNAL
jgi:hypothetical protein